MSVITHATPLPQIAYAAASIGDSYTLAGNFTQGVQMMTIISTLDTAVQVSFDGVNDHVAVPAGSAATVIIQFDFITNRLALSAPAIFVKEIGEAASGSLYVTAFGMS